MQSTEQFEQLAGFLNQWPWLETEYYGNTAGDYLSVIGTVLIVWIFSFGVSRLLQMHGKRLTSKTSTRFDDTIVEIVHRSITFILVLSSFYLGLRSLNFPEVVTEVSEKALFILFTLKIARELDRFAHFFMQSYLEPYARKQKGITRTFLAPFSRISKFTIWSLAILLIVGNLGYNISSLLAGLGVGGLAFALAAQETLSNAFGSIAIVTDQPFKMGDYVRIGDTEGTVVDVGLRSTKIQTLENNYVSIPNKSVASATIENFSERKTFNVNLKIGIGFNTSASDIKELIKQITRILRKEAFVEKDSFRINVTDFGDYSIELSIFYYITDVSSYARSIELRQNINLKIKSTIEKMGIDIPYPIQSLRIENAKDFLPTKGRAKTH